MTFRFVRRAPSFNRFVDSFAVINAVAFVLFAASGEFRLDVAGKDCRNFYVERFKFDTKRLGKRRHRRFRAGIKRLKRQRQRRARAGHIDYRAAAVFAHNGDNRLRSEQRAEVIDVKIFRTALSAVSSTAPEMPNPALLTRTSIRPARFTTSPIESNTFSRSDTSVFMLSMPSAGVLDKLNTRYPFSENFCNGIPDSLGCARNNCNFHNPPLNDYTIMFEYLQIVFKTLDSIFI